MGRSKSHSKSPLRRSSKVSRVQSKRSKDSKKSRHRSPEKKSSKYRSRSSSDSSSSRYKSSSSYKKKHHKRDSRSSSRNRKRRRSSSSFSSSSSKSSSSSSSGRLRDKKPSTSYVDKIRSMRTPTPPKISFASTMEFFDKRLISDALEEINADTFVPKTFNSTVNANKANEKDEADVLKVKGEVRSSKIDVDDDPLFHRNVS